MLRQLCWLVFLHSESVNSMFPLQAEVLSMEAETVITLKDGASWLGIMEGVASSVLVCAALLY